VFTKNGIVEINKDQRQLEMMMFELQNKFKNISEDFFNELDRDDHKIFQKELKEEDITEYKNVAVGKNA
jgi:TRAP-type C4-dicarboxylate transport system substrate-binding protein